MVRCCTNQKAGFLKRIPQGTLLLDSRPEIGVLNGIFRFSFTADSLSFSIPFSGDRDQVRCTVCDEASQRKEAHHNNEMVPKSKGR